MAALLASSRMQSSFLGASVRQNGCFTARRACPCSVVIRAAHGDIPKIGGGKKWVHTPVNKNGKPIKVTMHVKKGDLVQVSAGLLLGLLVSLQVTLYGIYGVKGCKWYVRWQRSMYWIVKGLQIQVSSYECPNNGSGVATTECI